MAFWILFLLLAQEQPTFRSDVALVRVDAEVRQDGRSVADLGVENFRVMDGGRPQKIVYFGHEREAMDVVLLFDLSSETQAAVKRVAEAAHVALGDLRAGDRVAVMTTGRTAEHCRPKLILDFSSEFGAAERSLRDEVTAREFDPQTMCEVLEGIGGAAREFVRQPEGTRRRAIVVITDDRGPGTSGALVRKTVRDLWKANAVVVGVLVESGIRVMAIGPPHRGARYAADQTGGDVLKTPDAVAGLHEMMERLRLRYSMYYAMPAGQAGEQRKIGVRLDGNAAKRYPRATVRARAGYVVE